MYADNPEDREDLQQEIMIQLWKSYAYFKGESAFSSWMYRVAVNTSLTYFKKEKKRSNTFTDNENVNEPAQEDYNDTQDTQLQLFLQSHTRNQSHREGFNALFYGRAIAP